eukprot:scaffold64160_cov65-Phaeocystis_antarctica.AAC.4
MVRKGAEFDVEGSGVLPSDTVRPYCTTMRSYLPMTTHLTDHTTKSVSSMRRISTQGSAAIT